jgi:hypothetical protein
MRRIPSSTTVKDHRVEVDGHYYGIFRMNAADAEERGIKDGDSSVPTTMRGSVIFLLPYHQAGTEGYLPLLREFALSTILWARLGNPDDRGGCINLPHAVTPAVEICHRHDDRALPGAGREVVRKVRGHETDVHDSTWPSATTATKLLPGLSG